MAVLLSLFAGAGAQFFDNNGSPLVGGKIYSYQAGTTTPETTYTTSAGNTAHTNPIILDSAGRIPSGGEIWLTDGVSYKFIVATSANVTISTYDNVTGNSSGVFSSFAASNGSSLIGFLQSGAGADPRTVQAKLRDMVSAADFGAIGNGIANDTVPLKNFFAACMAGKRGYLGAGTYMVDEGEIVIQPISNVDTPGFYVETAGYSATILKGRGTTQAPLITIQNLTQTSGAGKFIKGGYLGDIGFDGSSQPGGWSNSHALSLRGLDGWEFGYIYAVSLKGDLLHIPQNLYGGNNPDPYHVAFCTFRGLQSNFGNGWVLNNDNFVGFTSNEVFNVACYGTVSGAGAIRSCGAGNIYKKISVGTCWGWAIEVYNGSAGGRMSREEFQIAELDDPEYGIYVYNGDQAIFDQIRIVHRYHAGVGYWPRESLRLSDASNPALSNTTFDITHRIEAGGVIGDLGGFLRCQDSNAITGCEVIYRIVDNAGFGITNATLLAGATINNLADIRVLSSIQGDRTVIYDSQAKPVAFVTLNASATIPSGGFATISNKISTTGEVYDRRNNFNTSTSSYTVPVTGLYIFSCSVSVSGVASGTLFRFGLFNETTSSIVKYFAQETDSTGKVVFTGTGMILLTAGDIVSLNADNNSGSAVPINTVISAAAENSWSIQLIESAR